MRAPVARPRGAQEEGRHSGPNDAAYAAGVGNLPLPQRVTRAVGESPLSERIAHAQEVLYGPVIDWARRSPLHTDALGHSVHPLLTDLTLGCWMSASILDLAGGTQARGAAALLAGAGVAAAGPTAIAGTGDWAEMSGAERRIGAVRALGYRHRHVPLPRLVRRTDAWPVRRRNQARPRRQRGRSRCPGFLGGHLALNRGTARRVPAAEHAGWDGPLGPSLASATRVRPTPWTGSLATARARHTSPRLSASAAPASPTCCERGSSPCSR